MEGNDRVTLWVHEVLDLLIGMINILFYYYNFQYGISIVC